jgi:hypothetical protein
MQKFDARQSIYRGTLDQLSTANNPELDNLLLSADSDLTPLLRLSANTPNSLIINVGASDLLNSESSRRRAIPHIGTAYVQFSSGTVTFPAASGGNITTSTGGSSLLTIASGNFAAVLIYLDGAGGLNTAVGADAASATLAITNLPPAPDETIAAGFVVVQNVAGVIQNIAQSAIRQFGSGSGGGGSGDASSLDTILRDRFANLGMKYLDPNIFRRNKATKVDLSSTGSFDLVKNAFKFTSIAQTLVSSNAANNEFLTEAVDITEVELYAHWLLGFIDTAATYEVSRDGGTNWQAVSMARVGTESNAYRGYHVFANESVLQNLQTVAATGAGQSLNATTRQELSSQFVMSTTGVLRTVDLQLNFGAAGVGLLTVKLVRNNAGVPSTNIADILSESNPISIPSIASGNSTLVVDMPDVVLPAGTYHIVLSTDAAYKAGTQDLSWRDGSGTNGATFNGTTWTGSASTKAYTAKGRNHDLRIRITGGTANTFLEGYGLYFGADDGITAPNGTKNVQRFYFSGDENRTSFPLNWTPDPDLLEIYDPYRGQVYMIEEGVARIAGQTVLFESGTFDFAGEDIVLVFKQVKGIAIDNSDSNAAKNSEQDSNLLDVGSQIEELDFVQIPKVAVPFTQIVNRAQIIDPSQDLNARMGVNRIVTQQIARIQNEFGPNGESVFKPANDRFDQMRFVGTWINANGPAGVSAFTQEVGAFAEITFYGTGLNLVSQNDATARDNRASVDGGAEGANFAVNGSGVLNNRNYAMNVILPVVSGLSLGIHTVKIRCAAVSMTVFGVEILNETQNIHIRPGSQLVKGKKRTLAVEDLESFNSGFETGTLGTRGGRVVIYQKADNSIGKAVTPTDATQLNLASANHASEEVVRVYSPREFGAGRTSPADDFSTLLNAASARAFTLDDGTTTLVANNGRINTINNREALFNQDGTSNFFTFTFVGTGLDVTVQSAPALGCAISIDGTSIGNLNLTGTRKIVSGLPYGTHTVRFTNNDVANIGASIADFIVYQPKTPSIPTGAKAIAAYNVMANFVANATAGIDTIGTAVLRKQNVRELTYVGAGISALLSVGNCLSGTQLFSLTNADYAQYTFFGTGFEFRYSVGAGGADTATVTVDGSTNLSGFTTSVYGAGSTFTAATGLISAPANSLSHGITVRGLTLGLHTVRVTKTSGAGNWFWEAFDIITPIHSPKSNLYSAAQNTLTVGSQGIEDLRKIKALEQITDQKAVSQATGVVSNPTTTSLTPVPCPDMSVTHVSKTGRIRLSYAVVRSHNAVANTAIQPYVNGQAVGELTRIAHSVGFINCTSDSFVVNVPVGVNKVDLYWYAFDAGTTTGYLTARKLVVEDV